MSASASTTSPSTSTSPASIAVVTGATGYVAGHVIDQLIRSGYSVRGTVRSTSDPKSTQLLKDFPGLQLFQADLLQEGSFEKAIAGARYVFHVASPVPQGTVEDGMRELVEPALKGTTTVVRSALASPSVEAIILTSSIATVFDFTRPAGYTYTEADWNDGWTVEQAPYQLSKVRAERRAWELVNAHNDQPNQSHPVRLVAILPSVILGPPKGSRVDGYSVSILTDLLNGSQVESGVAPTNWTDVDVRDVAAAHLAAAERTAATGRYIVSGRKPATHLDYVELLRPSFPQRAMPSKAQGPWLMQDHTFDNSRSIRELGLHYTPQEQSVNDMLAKLIDIGLVKKD